ncbi:MAG: hypothetical protein P0107_05340 [Nitrosomonas sp.]|nr:hypothetical protein [Nitrosomonas sp.]
MKLVKTSFIEQLFHVRRIARTQRAVDSAKADMQPPYRGVGGFDTPERLRLALSVIVTDISQQAVGSRVFEILIDGKQCGTAFKVYQKMVSTSRISAPPSILPRIEARYSFHADHRR